MAKDFNVYKWRREHLNENQESFSDAFNKDNGVNNFTKPEKVDYTERYFDTMISQNEGKNEKVIKKIKDLTVQDVMGTFLPPTVNSMTSEYIDERPMFNDEWRQVRLDRWRDTLYQDSPGSEEWEVSIMTNQIGRKVLDWGDNSDAQKYVDAGERRDQAAQADYDANRGKYQGD